MNRPLRLHASLADLRRQRLEQRSRPGRPYLLELDTLYRRSVFDDAEAARAVCRVVGTGWLWRDSRLLAWVLLPAGWQALLVLGERDSLRTLVGRFKALSSRAVEGHHRINGWLWGRGFRDRMLPATARLEDEAERLLHLPCAQRLVARPGDWPWWNSQWLPAPG
ncbi:transposase [Arenimonas fontis]|uniref:Transposase n=1 Tax=Arenimonas fontis TaxID=2608255 RepID=A0A5B2ZB04_9GAMM|nr:transposase [Arenimonas fontis]KAA2285229.1 transposase [Arenimonas fontis]